MGTKTFEGAPGGAGRAAVAPDEPDAVSTAMFCSSVAGYEQYNVVAKKLDRRLAALGARAALERGLGDEQAPAGYEAALDAWLPRLWAALRAAAPLPPGVPEARRTSMQGLRFCCASYVAFVVVQPAATAAGVLIKQTPEEGRYSCLQGSHLYQDVAPMGCHACGHTFATGLP